MSQNMKALALANSIRTERANVCKAIKTQADAAEVILTSEIGLPVRDVLRAIDRWDEHKADGFMGALGINYYAVLGGERKASRYPLTDRQRREIAEALTPSAGEAAA